MAKQYQVHAHNIGYIGAKSPPLLDLQFCASQYLNSYIILTIYTPSTLSTLPFTAMGNTESSMPDIPHTPSYTNCTIDSWV
jgi:hypothetical protein